MKRISLKTNCALALAVAGMLAVGPVVAQKPDWAGGDKGGKGGRMEKSENNKGGRMEKSENNKGGRRDDHARSPRNRGEPAVRAGEYFGDQHRTFAHQHYHDEFQRGRCPPGLAKKNNGCMPPGLARKWAVGRPLPHDVTYHNVPPALITQFGQPPTGYRYVRVGGDILLVKNSSGMVIDAIQNLGRK
jgi:Ni/Co efflux regulator RcnB